MITFTEQEYEALRSWQAGKEGAIVGNSPCHPNDQPCQPDIQEAYGGTYFVGESMTPSVQDLILRLAQHVIETGKRPLEWPLACEDDHEKEVPNGPDSNV